MRTSAATCALLAWLLALLLASVAAGAALLRPRSPRH